MFDQGDMEKLKAECKRMICEAKIKFEKGDIDAEEAEHLCIAQQPEDRFWQGQEMTARAILQSIETLEVERRTIDEPAHKPLLELTLAKIVEIESYIESRGKSSDLLKIVEDIAQIRKELESRGTRPNIILEKKCDCACKKPAK